MRISVACFSKPRDWFSVYPALPRCNVAHLMGLGCVVSVDASISCSIWFGLHQYPYALSVLYKQPKINTCAKSDYVRAIIQTHVKCLRSSFH